MCLKLSVLKGIYFYFMCFQVLPVPMCTCLLPTEPEEGVRSQETGVKGSESHHTGVRNEPWVLWGGSNCS